MNILDKAIKATGGVSALARNLGIEPTAIHNWKTRGLPHAWEQVLLLMYRHGDGVFTKVRGHSSIDQSQEIAR